MSGRVCRGGRNWLSTWCSRRWRLGRGGSKKDREQRGRLEDGGDGGQHSTDRVGPLVLQRWEPPQEGSDGRGAPGWPWEP